MRVAIIQPSFFPWRGFFDIIASVDLFVFLDDVQYTKRDWRNRNIIKTSVGPRWLTVPVQASGRATTICETLIDYSEPFALQHARQFEAAYRSAPFCGQVKQLLEETYRERYASIGDLAIATTANTCRLLGITTPLIRSSEMGVSGAKTDRLLAILAEVGGSTYVSGPSADGYLDKGAFLERGIRLEYKNYEYRAYPQLWGDFLAQVSILDLIANVGEDCMEYLISAPNSVITEVSA